MITSTVLFQVLNAGFRRSVRLVWWLAHRSEVRAQRPLVSLFGPRKPCGTALLRSQLCSESSLWASLSLGLMLWCPSAFGANRFGTILEHNIGVMGTSYYQLEYQ